jgi:hypothetical protein
VQLALSAATMAFVSPKLDQVSASKIIEEAIRREERMIRLGTEFTVHSTRKSELCKCTAAHPTDCLAATKTQAATTASMACQSSLEASKRKLPTTQKEGFKRFPAVLQCTASLTSQTMSSQPVSQLSSSYRQRQPNWPHWQTRSMQSRHQHRYTACHSQLTWTMASGMDQHR